MHGPRMSTALLCALALVVGATAATPLATAGGPVGAQAQACPGATKTRFDLTEAQFASALACLINEQRGRAGLPALRTNVDLRDVASRHTKTMNRRRCRLPECPGEAPLQDRVAASGYTSAGAGAAADLTSAYEESLESGREGAITPKLVIKGWLVGDTRELMLNPEFADFGAGVTFGSIWRRTGPPGKRRIHIRPLLMQIVFATPAAVAP